MSNESEEKRRSYEDGAVVHNVDGDSKPLQLVVNESRTAEQRLVRKLDGRLLPTIVIIYVMNYIDRVALSSARLQGLETDLGMSDIQYDTLVAILYASYCPAQIPSNIIVNYVSRPSLYISTCVVLWGLVSALTGTTRNFSDILACRFLLGLPEAAFYPGCMYLLSSWYTKEELALRAAILEFGLLIANAFGNLWAAGVLANMNGARGIAAWRWLFYIEGAVTIFVGFCAVWLLPDHPTNTKWLTPEERHLAQVRLAKDAGEADQDSKEASVFEGLRLALRDPKVLIFMLMCFTQALGTSFTNFFPTLTATLGYSSVITLLVSAPPWVFGAIVTLINSRHADITGERFFHQVGWWCVTLIGYIIALVTMNTAARYFSMFLMVSAYCGVTMTYVWIVANAIPRPPAKRSVTIGMVNGFGNLGALVGSYIWKSSWAPEYHPTILISFCSLVLACALSFTMRTLLVRENKQMEDRELDEMGAAKQKRIEEAARLEGITFEEAVRRRMKFRYLY